MQTLTWHYSGSLPAEWDMTDCSDWLWYRDSFMQRLRAYGITAEVRVIRQCWRLPAREETEMLRIASGRVLVREVLIETRNNTHQQWMFARTVIPHTTLTGQERELAHLNTRSLGSVLFSHPQMQRGEFQVTQLNPDSVIHKNIVRETRLPKEPFWARRSIFTLATKSLLLTEVFLPDVFAITGNSHD